MQEISLSSNCDPLIERFRKQGTLKLFLTLPFKLRDSELFTMSPDIDTYVYLLFLRMSLSFFAILSCLNLLLALPLYLSGKA